MVEFLPKIVFIQESSKIPPPCHCKRAAFENGLCDCKRSFFILLLFYLTQRSRPKNRSCPFHFSDEALNGVRTEIKAAIHPVCRIYQLRILDNLQSLPTGRQAFFFDFF